MSFEEQFDKIINNKMNESEFPFDEKNWEKARNLIDANRILPVAKNNSKNLVFLALLFISVAGIATFTYFKLNDSSTIVSSNTTNKSSSDLINTNSNTNAILNSLKANELNSNTNSEKLVVANNSNSATNSDLNKGYVKSIQKFKKVSNSQKNTTNETNATNSEVLESKTTDNVSPSTTNTEKNNESVNSNSNSAEEKNGASNDKTKIGNTQNSISNFNKLGQSGANSSKILAVLDKKQNKATDEVTENVLQSSLTLASNDLENNVFESMTPVDTDLGLLATEHDCKNLNANFLAIYDGDYYKNTKPKFNYLNVEAGYMYLFGWNAPKIKDGAGFNYYASINYGIYISSKTSISIGVQAYNVGNIKQPFYSASQTVYEFGSTGSYTNITTNALYYVSIPLKFSYSISKNDKIGVGLNTGFLVGGKNTIETYNLLDGVKSNPETTTNKGYYENTNTKNIMLNAFYSRKLNKRISLNGEFIYGLSDVYLNTKTNITKQNIMGVKLGLTFTLFDK